MIVKILSVEFAFRRMLLKGLAVACAAALAASIAHFLIDLAGDYVLAHDAYDDVGHGSRPLASQAAFLLGSFLATRVLLAACGAGEIRRGALRGAVLGLVGRQPLPFVLLVACATLAATAAMEYADVAAAGSTSADIAALFGGSLALGCGISIAVALAVAFGLRRLLLFVASSEATIARLLASWLRCARTAAPGSRAHDVLRRPAGSSFAGPAAARRTGKRAPPLLPA